MNLLLTEPLTTKPFKPPIKLLPSSNPTPLFPPTGRSLNDAPANGIARRYVGHVGRRGWLDTSGECVSGRLTSCQRWCRPRCKLLRCVRNSFSKAAGIAPVSSLLPTICPISPGVGGGSLGGFMGFGGFYGFWRVLWVLEGFMGFGGFYGFWGVLWVFGGFYGFWGVLWVLGGSMGFWGVLWVLGGFMDVLCFYELF